MSEQDADKLKAQVEQLSTAQVWALVRWLFLYWALREKQDLMRYLGKG